MYKGYIYIPTKEYLNVIQNGLEGTGSSISKIKTCQTRNGDWIIVYIQSQTANHYKFFMYELKKKLTQLGMYLEFKKLNAIRKGITNDR